MTIQGNRLSGLSRSISLIGKCLEILPRRDKRNYLVVVVIQIISSLLDLLGVAIIGIIGALAVNGVQSLPAGSRIAYVLNFLNLQEFSFQTQVAALGLFAALVLVLRTLFSVFLSRKMLFFLSRRSAVVSKELVSKLLSRSLLEIQKRPSQLTLHALTDGVVIVCVGILGTLAAITADLALLIVLFSGLLYINPTIALSTIVLFGSIAFLLFKLLSVRARHLGVENSRLSIASAQKVLEVLSSYRELLVHDRRQHYAEQIGKSRSEISNVMAEMQFMPSISKYVIETTMVLGTFLVAAAQFSLLSAREAVAGLAIFMASGTRIAPAIMRIQQGLIQIRSNIGAAQPTLDLIEDLNLESTQDLDSEIRFSPISNFTPNISMKSVSFYYPGRSEAAISSLDLEISSGEFIAIVGPSGAGKTTLVDVLLGVIPPTSGSIEISGFSPSLAVSIWPGAISYVPQDVIAVSGSIRENVALGYSRSEIDETAVWRALEIAHLSSAVIELPNGIETEIGEGGTRLSGGQRQRLGIARAMYTNPQILVMDEATSSLDGQTESGISESVKSLKGNATVIVVAHRLSTIKDADRVIYLDSGQKLAEGSFNEVRAKIPNFDEQARLLGLT
jgi:ABC-type multidrug transport system fused ATPase/permease subunit